MGQVIHLIRALPDAVLHEIGDHLLHAYAALERPSMSDEDRIAARNAVAEALNHLGFLSAGEP